MSVIIFQLQSTFQELLLTPSLLIMSDKPNDPKEPSATDPHVLPNYHPSTEIPSFVRRTASTPPRSVLPVCLDSLIRVTEPENSALQVLKDAFTTFEAKSKKAKETSEAEKVVVAQTIARYERTGQLRVAGRQEAIAKKEEAVEATFRQALREATTSRQVLEATASREEGRASVAQTKLNYLEEEQKIKAGQQATVRRDVEAGYVTFRQANKNTYSSLRAAFNVYVEDQENRGRRRR